MAGNPWEDYAPSAPAPPAPTEPGPWEDYKSPDIQLQQVRKPHYEQRPDVTIPGEVSSGFEKMITPGRTAGGWTYPSPVNVLTGGAQAVGGLTAPITNLVSRGAKVLSEPFESRPQPPPTRIPYQVNPQGQQTYVNIPVPHPAESVGKMAELAGDVGSAWGLGKVAGLLSGPLKRLLPTVGEKVAATETAGAAKISDVQRMAQEAQQAQAAGAAAREATIPAAKEAAALGAGSDIGSIQAGLTMRQQQVGEAAARAAAPKALNPRRANFQARYDALKDQGRAIETAPINLNAAAKGIAIEPGFGPTNTAERNAMHINRVLTEAHPVEIEEEIGNQVRRMIEAGGEAKKTDYNAIVKSVLGPVTAENVSVEQLINTQKRLNAAEAAAYSAGHKNLGRQFGILEDSVKADIAAANPSIARQLKNVDKDYFKQKATEWYTNGVQDAFDPKTGVWDRKRFTKWWDNHADEIDNNKYLRRMLGDKYEGTAQLVKDMQQATETNIEKAAKTAIQNRQRQYGQELRDIGQREKGYAKLTKAQDVQTSQALDQGVKQITDDTKKKIEAITGRPYSEASGGWVGPLMILHGITSGNPAAVMSGIGAIVTHDGLIRVLNSARGINLLRRTVRAVPGTAQAAAAGRALTSFANAMPEAPEAETPISTETPAPTQQPVTPKPARDSGAAKRRLIEKYGLGP